MKRPKNLYKGTYNWYGEVMTLYVHASDPQVAKVLFIRRIANKMGRSIITVQYYFDGSKDNFRIEEVKK